MDNFLFAIALIILIAILLAIIIGTLYFIFRLIQAGYLLYQENKFKKQQQKWKKLKK